MFSDFLSGVVSQASRDQLAVTIHVLDVLIENGNIDAVDVVFRTRPADDLSAVWRKLSLPVALTH